MLTGKEINIITEITIFVLSWLLLNNFLDSFLKYFVSRVSLLLLLFMLLFIMTKNKAQNSKADLKTQVA